MKKLFIPFVFILFLCGFSTQEASAKIRIPYGDYEKISKIYDLPREDAYEYEDGKYFDLGVKYTVFQIAWIPLYQKETAQLVGYIGDSDNYLILQDDYLEALAVMHDVEDWNNYIKIPFWDNWGGKMVAGVIVILIVVGIFSGRKDKEDDEEEKPETEAA